MAFLLDVNGIFLHFRKAHPFMILSKKAFDALRPFWVKKMKERNVYYCIYHVEMEELKVGFNHMWQKSELQSSSHCDYDCEEICEYVDGLTIGYMDSQATYSKVIKMWESIACPKDHNFEWHAQNCI
jgi:hypothetical protein